MNIRNAKLRGSHFMICLLVFISGFAALIYEIIWQKYLSILLGSQATATSLVLAIYLGGMSMGYFLFGSYVEKFNKKQQGLIYVALELIIGVWAFFFSDLFHWIYSLTPVFYKYFGLQSLWIDLFLSLILIGLPTLLIGGTLPVLLAWYSLSIIEGDHVELKVYGWNTVGASFGALVAGYFLIPYTSFNYALGIGASLNVIVVLSFVILAFISRKSEPAINKPELSFELTPKLRLFGFISFISGFCIVTIETLLIRLLGLTVGTSNSHFSLTVFIFILSLGLGSFMTRKIKADESWALFYVLLGSFLSLSLLYCTVNLWPYTTHLIRISLTDLLSSFYLYEFLLGVVFLLSFFIPISMCGMVLPMCLRLVQLGKGAVGNKIGWLFGVNAIGCVLGALIGGHLLFYTFNIDSIFRLTLLLLLCTSFILLHSFSTAHKKAKFYKVNSFILLLIVIAVLPKIKMQRFLQAFRSQHQLNESFKGPEAFEKALSFSNPNMFWKDGPNTSVGIVTYPNSGPEISKTLFVNGKSDGNTLYDFFTTVLLAEIPLVFSEKIERTFVVGFGTGVTVGALAEHPDTKEIDVAEISGTIIENAYRFDAYNGRASNNKKIKIHEMDAFRYLMGSNKKYDLVISEPSNPWVSGVENLYSKEFYQLVKKHLNSNGVIAQWLHTYSFNDELIKLVLSTLRSEFKNVHVFELKGDDLVLLASDKPIELEDIQRAKIRLENSRFQGVASMINMKLIESILFIEALTPQMVTDLVQNIPFHSLEVPRLSHQAAIAFFRNEKCNIKALKSSVEEIREDYLLEKYLNGSKVSKQLLTQLQKTFCEQGISRSPFTCNEIKLYSNPKKPQVHAEINSATKIN